MPQTETVSLRRLFWAFLVTGATAFGGGSVAHLRDRLVRSRGWLNDDEFVGVLAMSQLVPGIIATNVSVLVGDNMRGVAGAVVAALGMIIPGAIIVALLGLMASDGHIREVLAPGLRGVAAAAVGLLGAVCWQLGKKQIKNWGDVCLMLLTFTLAGPLKVPMGYLLLTVAPFSVWIHRPRG